MAPGGYREEIQRQLGGKHVVMIGDSTLRENYIGLLCMLWEEKLIEGDPRRVVESAGKPQMAEDRGHIEVDFPELGNGTRFTFIRKNWGGTGKFTMKTLDTADIAVANMALHYRNPKGIDKHYVRDENATYKSFYARDVQDLLDNMTARGRPGHRAIWRETVTCLLRDSSEYGCLANSSNSTFEVHKVVLSALPAYKGVEVLPSARLFEPLWWAHPGAKDCCHMVSRLPGVLSVVPRMLVSMLAQPPGQFAEPERTPYASNCPSMKRLCLSEAHRSGRPCVLWSDDDDFGL